MDRRIFLLTIAVALLVRAGEPSSVKLLSIAPDPIKTKESVILSVKGSGFQKDFAAQITVDGNVYPLPVAACKFADSANVQVEVFLGCEGPCIAYLTIINPDGGKATKDFQVNE